eukprot:9418046-Alexandrium_andersonii.AAC.1
MDPPHFSKLAHEEGDWATGHCLGCFCVPARCTRDNSTWSYCRRVCSLTAPGAASTTKPSKMAS